MQSQSQYFDLIILGAGITGLSVARQELLTESGCKVEEGCFDNQWLVNPDAKCLDLNNAVELILKS